MQQRPGKIKEEVAILLKRQIISWCEKHIKDSIRYHYENISTL